jgi:hypothetical protein
LGLASQQKTGPPEVDVVSVNNRLTVRFTVPAAAFALVGSAGRR